MDIVMSDCVSSLVSDNIVVTSRTSVIKAFRAFMLMTLLLQKTMMDYALNYLVDFKYL